MTECVLEDQTMNQTYYLKVLATLWEGVCKKWPELWKKKSWMLHQDNAPAHNMLSVKCYLAARSTLVLEHEPYLLDLAPCDFYLFLKISLL